MKVLKKYNQYIKGNINESELDAFTREVVKEHFEKEQLQDRWSQILEEEHHLQEEPKENKKLFSLKNPNRFLKTGLAIAATISLLILFWFSNQALPVPGYEKLLSEEFNKPYIESIGRKGKVEELRLQAVAAYNEREYATAESYFDQLNKIEKTEDWEFYIALCQLYQKQSDLAIRSFSALLDHPDKKYILEINWYLGLAYTLKKDFDSAKKHLSFVVEQSDDEMAWKVKEAKELLDAFNEKE